MIRYLKNNPAAFNPETVRLLGNALDESWRQVQADKTYKIDGNSDGARDMLAKHIVEMAKLGEMDQQRLVQGALDRLRL
jgi:hypothetical protein